MERIFGTLLGISILHLLEFPLKPTKESYHFGCTLPRIMVLCVAVVIRRRAEVMKLSEKLSGYLAQIGAGRVSFQSHPDASRALPLFLSQAYDVSVAALFGKVYTLLVARSADRPTPAQAAKHIETARRVLGPDVAFVFPEMPSFDRTRFVEKGVPFIVPGRQTFLPMALVNLRESGGRAVAVEEDGSDTLSAPAQAVLLYYLQHTETRGWPLNHWAKALGYSPSTMTRVRAEFARHGLCEEHGGGRLLVFVFPEDRRVLWQKAGPRLVSPVRSRHHVVLNGASLASHLLRSGISALADLSMLATPPEDVYAVHSPRFRELIDAAVLKQMPAAVENSAVVERWKYDPVPLSAEGKRVDMLSLALSLRDNHDERVQGALDELLKDLPW